MSGWFRIACARRLISASGRMCRAAGCVVVAAGLLGVTGCMTKADYERMLSGWAGATEVALVAVWGIPDKTYEVDGSKFLSYVSSEDLHFPEIGTVLETTVKGDTYYTRRVGGFPGDHIQTRCETTFRIVDTKVVSWKFKGDGCVAR